MPEVSHRDMHAPIGKRACGHGAEPTTSPRNQGNSIVQVHRWHLPYQVRDKRLPNPLAAQRQLQRRHRAARGAVRCKLKLGFERSPRVDIVQFSMTWSARTSTDAGIVRPRVLAALRLMTSSNFVG